MIAFAFAGIASLIFAFQEPQSQPPIPTPSPVAEVKQQHGHSETPASEASKQPIFGTIQSPKPTKRQGDQQANKSTANWSLIFAGVIALGALVQIFAVIVQAGFTRRQLRLTKQAADAATKSAETAEKNVQQAMDMTRLDQRAWLAVTTITGEAPQAGQRFNVKIIVTNTGKTFAKNVRVSSFSRSVPRDQPVPNFAEEVEAGNVRIGEDRSVGIMAPNATYTSPLITEGGISAATTEDFRRGRTILYIFGRITYDDIFDCPHWTTFCSVMDRNGDCSVFGNLNDADNNHPP